RSGGPVHGGGGGLRRHSAAAGILRHGGGRAGGRFSDQPQHLERAPRSGRHSSIWMTCAGFLNWGKYCNKSLDTLFAQAAGTPDPEKRAPFYRQISDTYLTEMPDMVLYHFTWLWAMSDKVG